MQKEQFSMFMLYFESNRAGRCRERRYADHVFIQIGLYFRRAFHHFVVNFSNDPLNQNAADVTACSGYSVTGRNPPSATPGSRRKRRYRTLFMPALRQKYGLSLTTKFCYEITRNLHLQHILRFDQHTNVLLYAMHNLYHCVYYS